MSPATSDAHSTDQQSSFLHVKPTRYTRENHHKFVNEPSIGLVCIQQDIKGKKGITSTRYLSIVSNTKIGDLPEIGALLIDTGKQVVEVDIDGDLEDEWSRMDKQSNGCFRETTRKIWEIAQQSRLGPFREWYFGNGTDHEKLLENKSVKMWTTRPPPNGQHSTSSTGGKKSAPSLPPESVVPRDTHYVSSDSDDSGNTIPRPPKVLRGRQPTRDGE